MLLGHVPGVQQTLHAGVTAQSVTLSVKKAIALTTSAFAINTSTERGTTSATPVHQLHLALTPTAVDHPHHQNQAQFHRLFRGTAAPPNSLACLEAIAHQVVASADVSTPTGPETRHLTAYSVTAAEQQAGFAQTTHNRTPQTTNVGSTRAACAVDPHFQSNPTRTGRNNS